MEEIYASWCKEHRGKVWIQTDSCPPRNKCLMCEIASLQKKLKEVKEEMGVLREDYTDEHIKHLESEKRVRELEEERNEIIEFFDLSPDMTILEEIKCRYEHEKRHIKEIKELVQKVSKRVEK